MYESQFEEELYNLRREKLRQIGELGQKAGLSYAVRPPTRNHYDATHTVADLLPLGKHADGTEKTAEELAAEHIDTSDCRGGLWQIRLQGKAGFAQLQQNGQRIQIYVRKDNVGEDAFALYKLLDLGDHIGVKGFLMRTRTGELTVHVTSLTFLAKAMLALPDKFHGLEDTELRYRQRYVDLFVNTGHGAKSATEPGAPRLAPADVGEAPQTPTVETDEGPGNVRQVFVKRAAILRAMRRFFDERGYLEVETPMMHTIAGGAAARPFTTHHNALDIDLKLRIAPELYLKRLVVGGMDRVYEINRNFRNEGISTQHNPEFTMLEFYQAYSNYHELMDLTEELVKYVANEVNGSLLTNFNGVEIDLGKWTKLSMQEAIVEFWPEGAGYPPGDSILNRPAHLDSFLSELYGPEHITDPQAAAKLADAAFAAWGNHPDRMTDGSHGRAIAALFEAVAEEHLIQPTIIYDFPLAVSPLSKVRAGRAGLGGAFRVLHWRLRGRQRLLRAERSRRPARPL